jgi:g-D-glutamyl-meso-diaminopimelate peptidase
MGYGIIIWDAYRPVYAQEKLWNIFPNPVYVSKPGTGSQSHSRGISIDLTLYDLKTGAVLEMPSKMDVFNGTSDRYYGDVSATAAANSRLLESVMVKYGFQPYISEWWHYSDKDTYPIEYKFDPAGGVRPPNVYDDQIIDLNTCVRNSPEEYFSKLYGTLWYATCLNSMALRAIASVNGRTLKVLRPNDPLVLLGCDGYFAKVSSNGTVGYVLWAYIKPADMNYFNQILNVVDYVDVYTYEMMTADLTQLQEMFPETVKLDTIGNSEWGTPIPVVRVGNEDAQYHVLIQASIHGCEHISTWVVMTMLDYWIGHAMSEYTDVCYHVIPMLNPDGVYTAQTKTLNDEQYQIYLNDKANGYVDHSVATYASNWKANGKGVDLNRNFPSGWELITYRDDPSYKLYAGEEPFDAAEAAALRDYTLLYDFDATLSYHTAGSILYYEYGKDSSINAQSASLAYAVKDVTGYPLVNSAGTDGAGYKDWSMDELKIPSLTVELGWAHPLIPSREQRPLFATHCHVMETVVDWLRENNR